MIALFVLIGLLSIPIAIAVVAWLMDHLTRRYLRARGWLDYGEWWLHPLLEGERFTMETAYEQQVMWNEEKG